MGLGLVGGKGKVRIQELEGLEGNSKNYGAGGNYSKTTDVCKFN